MSIENRAKKASPFTADQEWYIKGAKDQFDIDMVNAYDIYVEACRNGGYTYSQFKQRLIEHGKEC